MVINFRKHASLLAAAIFAVALGGLAIAAPTTASAATGCTLNPTNGSTAVNGTVTRTLGARSYELHVPKGLTGTQVPLLLSLHGFGSNGYEDESGTGWSTFADTHNFIVAYPDALGSVSGAWDPYTANSPDVTFIRSVVADISASWCVDAHNIHTDGWSNGAVMSQRVACDAADIIASTTSYVGGTPTLNGTVVAAPCKPSRPIAVDLIVGADDFTAAGLAPNTKEWVGYDNCSATPTSTTDTYGKQDAYSCASGTNVISRTLANQTHLWPTGAAQDDQHNRMWSFYQAHLLP